jgi:hypothetical protein
MELLLVALQPACVVSVECRSEVSECKLCGSQLRHTGYTSACILDGPVEAAMATCLHVFGSGKKKRAEPLKHCKGCPSPQTRWDQVEG